MHGLTVIEVRLVSTSFDVYPGKEYIPTFQQLLDLANEIMAERFAQLGVERVIALDMELYNFKTHEKIDYCCEDKAVWNEDCYVWFFIKGFSEGMDAYFLKTDDLDKEIWRRECETNENAKRLTPKIDNSIRIGYHWSFKRSAGQSALISLVYGLVAGALTQMTDGIIFTDDGAWDYGRFPAEADDFLEWYFRPEMALTNGNKEWATRCIESIKRELYK